MHSAFLQFLHEEGRTEIYKITTRHNFVTFYPELPQTETEWMYFVGVWCYRETDWLLSWACYFRAYWVYKYCTNCTVGKWTVLTVITQKLLLHVQLHNSTAHLLYKYCTSSTICNWTVLTVITQKLVLHFQLHNSTQTANLMSSEVKWKFYFETVQSHISRYQFSFRLTLQR
jgi:hypothetical protein